jgi:hypothetical protein
LSRYQKKRPREILALTPGTRNRFVFFPAARCFVNSASNAEECGLHVRSSPGVADYFCFKAGLHSAGIVDENDVTPVTVIQRLFTYCLDLEHFL